MSIPYGKPGAGLAKLVAQKFMLENQLLRLDLLDAFDPRTLIDQGELAKLFEDVEEAQRRIKTQTKARGATRIGIRLAIGLGVLVAKAAG